MVEFELGRAPSVWGFPEMQKEFSALFGGRRVDLVPPQVLDNPYRANPSCRTSRWCMARDALLHAADSHIVRQLAAGDLVNTADIPLAAGVILRS